MNKSLIGKVITLLVVACIAFCASAQDGNVNVTVPSGLTKRSNNAPSSSAPASAGQSSGAAARNSGAAAAPAEKKKKSNMPNVNTSQQKKAGTKVGFRIQVYNESSANGKAGAQVRAKQMALKFPQYRAYLTYNVPAWRLRLGDFLDQEDAQAALNRLKNTFPQFAKEMVIVKDTINLWRK